MDANLKATLKTFYTKLKDKFYTKSEVDTELDKKADASVVTALSTTVAGKADAATTIAGYGITNAYTKTEIDNLVAAKTSLEVVTSLPASPSFSKIYLMSNGSSETQNVYDEYIAIQGSGSAFTWEKIGTTKTDLSGYVKTADLAATEADWTEIFA